MRYVATVKVMPKKTVLDPQGSAVKGALLDLGYGGVKDVRIGKNIRVEMEAPSKSAAWALVEEMARKILSNPVIEEFEFAVIPMDSSGEGAGGIAP